MTADLVTGWAKVFLTPQRFSVSGVETYILLPIVVAIFVSTFTSMGGVSGAFLLVPFQVSFLNFTSPSVSATNHLFNVVAIPSGVYRYIREGRMNWPVTWVVILGTLPGVWLGALIRIRWLVDPRHFKLFLGSVLLYIGARLLYEQTGLARRRRGKILEFEDQVQARLGKVLKEAGHTTGRALPQAARVRTADWNWRRISYEFLGETFTFNAPALFLLSLVVGLIGGAYGIGGGSIMAPFLVAVFQLPVYTIAGSALTATCITSVAGVIIFAALSPYYHQAGPVAPDWGLGLLFGLGGFVGMYTGARLQRFLSAKLIRFGLGLVITGLAVRYITSFFF